MSIQTAFRLEESVLSKLKQLSKDDGRSMTWHVTKALNSYLCKGDPKPSKLKSEKAMPIGIDASEVIDYLNIRAGTKFKNTENNRKLIEPRIKEFSVDDCKTVIDKKCAEWLETDMAKYLRPATLFQASKFEGYLNQLSAVNKDAQRERELDRWICGNDSQKGETIDHEPF